MKNKIELFQAVDFYMKTLDETTRTIDLMMQDEISIIQDEFLKQKEQNDKLQGNELLQNTIDYEAAINSASDTLSVASKPTWREYTQAAAIKEAACATAKKEYEQTEQAINERYQHLGNEYNNAFRDKISHIQRAYSANYLEFNDKAQSIIDAFYAADTTYQCMLKNIDNDYANKIANAHDLKRTAWVTVSDRGDATLKPKTLYVEFDLDNCYVAFGLLSPEGETLIAVHDTLLLFDVTLIKKSDQLDAMKQTIRHNIFLFVQDVYRKNKIHGVDDLNYKLAWVPGFKEEIINRVVAEALLVKNEASAAASADYEEQCLVFCREAVAVLDYLPAEPKDSISHQKLPIRYQRDRMFYHAPTNNHEINLEIANSLQEIQQFSV